MIMVIIWFAIILKFVLSDNSEQLFGKGYFLYIFLGLPILLIIFRMNNLYDDQITVNDNFKNMGNWFKTQMQNPKMLILKIIAIGLFIALFSWTISTENTDNFMFFFNIIFFALLIVGVLVLFRTLKGVIYSLEGWLGVIGRIVFFIPCAISDFFFYIIGQITKTPFVVYVLIAIEIALILLYKFVPELFKKFRQSSATELLKTPTLLKKETKLESYNKLLIEKINAIPSNDLLSNKLSVTINSTDRKFSLSMWFYVVGMPPNEYPYNEEANIFKIGDDAIGNYHPKIVYDGSKNVCKVYYSKEPTDVTEFKITLQKWVHFVITYDSDVIDIFVNGELVKSVPRTHDSVVFAPTDNAVVGQKDGLFGGVCNVLYFGRPITKREIAMNYDLNKGLDPPTN